MELSPFGGFATRFSLNLLYGALLKNTFATQRQRSSATRLLALTLVDNACHFFQYL